MFDGIKKHFHGAILEAGCADGKARKSEKERYFEPLRTRGEVRGIGINLRRDLTLQSHKASPRPNQKLAE